MSCVFEILLSVLFCKPSTPSYLPPHPNRLLFLRQWRRGFTICSYQFNALFSYTRMHETRVFGWCWNTFYVPLSCSIPVIQSFRSTSYISYHHLNPNISSLSNLHTPSPHHRRLWPRNRMHSIMQRRRRPTRILRRPLQILHPVLRTCGYAFRGPVRVDHEDDVECETVLRYHCQT
jgi:hypothetical protein